MAKRSGNSGKGAAKNREAGAGDAARPTDPGLAWIERMRVYRCRPEPDLSVSTVAAWLEQANAQRRRALGDVIDLWNEVAPERVRGFATVDALAQGTLTLAVSGSSASYELSRLLRDGLERELVGRMPTRIRRVKVRVGSEE